MGNLIGVGRSGGPPRRETQAETPRRRATVGAADLGPRSKGDQPAAATAADLNEADRDRWGWSTVVTAASDARSRFYLPRKEQTSRWSTWTSTTTPARPGAWWRPK